MAEVVSEGKSLEQLDQEITCGICQEHYTEPKVLPCLHYYCKQCIISLALKAGTNKPFSCPECRHEATLPEGGVEELKTAFFVNRLKSTISTMEIAHGKVEMKCEACLEEPREKAEAFCRQCAMFICKDCIKSHKKMRMLSSHQIASLDDLKQGRSNPVVEKEVLIEMCPDHDEPLAIYCKDCDSLICRDCIMKDHKEHSFEFCKKAAPNTKKEMLKELEPLKELILNVSHAVKEVQTTKKELEAQGDTVATEIQASFMELHEILNKHEKELLDEAGKRVLQKLDNLSVQEKNLSLASAEIQSIVEYTEQCVRHCTDNEVMRMQAEMRSRMQRENEKHHKMSMEPVEEVDVRVEVRCAEALQQLCLTKANITKLPIDLTKSTVTMEVAEISEINEMTRATFKIIPILSNNKPTNEVTADAKAVHNGAISKCDINQIEANKYSIQYTPTVRGRHELTVLVDRQEVPGSPFHLFVSIPPTQLGKPVKVWDGISKPTGITMTSDGEIIVMEYERDIIKFDKEGKRQLLVRKSQHSLNHLRGIAVDSDDNIYCTDDASNRILKCDKNGGNIQVHEVKIVKGRGVAVVGDEVMVCQADNSGSIMVYDKALQYVRSIKHEGSGGFHDISADSHHNLYASDTNNSYIRVFKNDGTLSVSFCKDNNGQNRVSSPYGVHVCRQYVYVANNDSVSVFTTDGVYVISLGSSGDGEGQFRDPYSICVDKDGFVYVTDQRQNRVQCF